MNNDAPENKPPDDNDANKDTRPDLAFVTTSELMVEFQSRNPIGGVVLWGMEGPTKEHGQNWGYYHWGPNFVILGLLGVFQMLLRATVNLFVPDDTDDESEKTNE